MQNICVYGASSSVLDKVYLDAAYEMGRLIAEKGWGLVFGAGDKGVMGAAARGAHDAHGRVIGVIPEFMAVIPGVQYPLCDELIVTQTMRERKQQLEELSAAFVTAPGGIGTLEEFFEVLTLKQLQQHEKALVLLNVQDYYRPLLDMLAACVKEKFSARTLHSLFGVAFTPAEAMQYIETYTFEAIRDKWHDVEESYTSEQ